ncbi:unnamed protein product [Urochloa humidicola]
MSLLSWNCRGSGGSLFSPTMNHLARLITSTKAQDSQGNTTANAEEIAAVLICYFTNLFNSQLTGGVLHQPTLHQQPQQVPITDTFTSSIPDMQEVKDILKQMKRDASPGPDGLNVAFYRAASNWITEDITTLVQDFYRTDDLLICGKADLTEVMAIKQIFYSFCAASGQTPNYNKSSILFSKKGQS